MSDENVETARRALGAWTKRDVAATIETVHESMEWHPALTAGGIEGAVYHGPQGIQNWMAELDDTWAELTIEGAEFRDLPGNRVLQLGHFHAVGKKSGVPLDQPQAILFAFQDKKIVAAWGYASHREALEAAGLSE